MIATKSQVSDTPRRRGLVDSAADYEGTSANGLGWPVLTFRKLGEQGCEPQLEKPPKPEAWTFSHPWDRESHAGTFNTPKLAIRFFMETLHREVNVELGRSAQADELELSFSSSVPIERDGYHEILSHDSRDVDLSRLNSGTSPLLLDHDSRRFIGKVVRAWIEGGKGRAVVRFSKSAIAQEVYQDVVAGVRTAISVGYQIASAVATEVRDGAKFITFKWSPLEISFVGVPADVGVGVGRAATIKNHRTDIMEIEQTSDSVEISAVSKLLVGKVPNIEELANQAVLRGWSLKQFREEALKRLPSVVPMSRPEPLDISPQDIRRYSLGRAVATFAERGKLDGFEAEMDQECSRTSGQRAKGFWVPREALAENFGRSLVAGTASIGGNLVATQHMGDQFIDALRSRSAVMQMGAQILPGLNGNVEIPRLVGKSTIGWKTEIAASVQSNLELDKVTLTPKAATGFVVYSRQLLIQGIPSVDQLVRGDLTAQIAEAVDSACLRGIGGAEPAGIISVAAAGSAATLATGVNQVVLGDNGGALSYAALVSLEALIATDNADAAGMKFLTSPAVRGYLRAAEESTVSGQFVWTIPSVSSNPLEGRVLGYPAFVSSNAPGNVTKGTVTAGCSVCYLGDWSQIMIGQWGPGLDILTDVYTAAGMRQIKIYATLYTDIGLRHGESFGVVSDITG